MDGSLGQNHKLNWGCQNLRTSIIEESMVYIQVMIQVRLQNGFGPIVPDDWSGEGLYATLRLWSSSTL